MEEEIGPKGVGEGRLAAVELVGEWEEVEVEELQDLGLCFPIKMFSTVKLEMALLLGVFCNVGAVFLVREDVPVACVGSEIILVSSCLASLLSPTPSPSPSSVSVESSSCLSWLLGGADCSSLAM